MALINLDDPRPAGGGPAILALGFRPFFLLAALFAVTVMVYWLLALTGYLGTGDYYPPAWWHAHEMLFGYATAVIAGFLLTAARNWTGIQTARGTGLALLALLWLGGRLAAFAGAAAPALVLIDLSFLPALAVALAWPLLRIRQWRNLIFVPLLLLMAGANALVHGEITGWWRGSAAAGSGLMLWLVVLLMVVMGGRVIPFFTERGVAGSAPRRWRTIEAGAAAAVIVLIPIALWLPKGGALALAAAAAALIHAVRLAGWLSAAAWRVPLVWVLHCGYGWIVAGLLLTALAAAGHAPPAAAVHAFSAGAIGTLTLGMMARVTLGHTGRPLAAPRSAVAAFVLVGVAALARVAAAWPSPLSRELLLASAVLWIAAFAVFAAGYAAMWWHPRVDGRPG